MRAWHIICYDCDAREVLGTSPDHIATGPANSLAPKLREQGWHIENGRDYCPECWKRLTYTRQQQAKHILAEPEPDPDQPHGYSDHMR